MLDRVPKNFSGERYCQILRARNAWCTLVICGNCRVHQSGYERQQIGMKIEEVGLRFSTVSEER